MSNKHYQKWIIQMPLGFFLVGAGIIVIMYSANKRANEEWLIWGIVSVTVINSGLAILGNALVHKIKSDLIKKSKVKKTPQSMDDDFL
jgi:uncharacterized membrane protein HdeD (DUF308 family)